MRRSFVCICSIAFLVVASAELGGARGDDNVAVVATQPALSARYIYCRLVNQDGRAFVAVQSDDLLRPDFESEQSPINLWPVPITQSERGLEKNSALGVGQVRSFSDVRVDGKTHDLLTVYRTETGTDLYLRLGKGTGTRDGQVRILPSVASRGFVTDLRCARFLKTGAVGADASGKLWLVPWSTPDGGVSPGRPVQLGRGRAPVGLSAKNVDCVIAIGASADHVYRGYSLKTGEEHNADQHSQRLAGVVSKGELPEPLVDPRKPPAEGALQELNRYLREQATLGNYWDSTEVHGQEVLLCQRAVGKLTWRTMQPPTSQWTELPGTEKVLEYAATVDSKGAVCIVFFQHVKDEGWVLSLISSENGMKDWSTPRRVYHTLRLPVMVDMMSIGDNIFLAVIERSAGVDERMSLGVFSLPVDGKPNKP